MWMQLVMGIVHMDLWSRWTEKVINYILMWLVMVDKQFHWSIAFTCQSKFYVLPWPIICSDWLKFQRSSSLKLMNWLNPNCKWMIIGMFFTKFLVFMPMSRWTEKVINYILMWLAMVDKQFHWSIAFTCQSKFYVLPCLKLRRNIDLKWHIINLLCY
jgi:phage shock protein PspC (stress-responsive transcriptional regulator)